MAIYIEMRLYVRFTWFRLIQKSNVLPLRNSSLSLYRVYHEDYCDAEMTENLKTALTHIAESLIKFSLSYQEPEVAVA